MKLIFRQESQPAHTIFLILSQIGFNLDRDLILLGLASIKQLHEKFPLIIPLCQ
jgi:hypothetical protein